MISGFIDISFSIKNDYLFQKRSNYKVRYDLQNIVYSPKNGRRTKNITIDYNNENRLEKDTLFSALTICMAFG